MRRPASTVDDIIVLGAGVVGVTTAYALASRGASVILVDRGDRPAHGATFANGAQLSYAYTDALASPSLLARLPKLALGLDPVFRLTPSSDAGLYPWLASFLRNMTAQRFARNTLDVLALAAESRGEMHALLAQHSIAFAHRMPGKMHLYYSPATLRSAGAGVALKQRQGVSQEVLSACAAIAIEPALAQVSGLEGVVYSPCDAVGDARLFTEGMLDICQRELGVRAHFGFDVATLRRAGELWSVGSSAGQILEARRIVLCAGAQSGAIARKLGFALPIQPMKGYSFTAPRGPDSPRVSITDTMRKLVFCELGGQMRVAGLAELGNASTTIDPARARLLRDLSRQAMPGAASYDHIKSEWAGLRPMTPDSRPIVRWVDRGLGLNVGHGMLGWTLAVGSAARIARSIPAWS